MQPGKKAGLPAIHYRYPSNTSSPKKYYSQCLIALFACNKNIDTYSKACNIFRAPQVMTDWNQAHGKTGQIYYKIVN